MKKLLLVLSLFLVPAVHADSFSWSIGGVSLQLPSSGNAIEPFLGADVRFQQAVWGLKTSYLNIYNEVKGDLGVSDVIGAQNNIQPYIGLSQDLKRHIPVLSSLTDLNLNVATRYNTDVGGKFLDHLGAIFSLGYSFN